MPDRLELRLTLNGRPRVFSVPPGRRLLDLLRDDAGLTGTKEGCGSGECGACTVLLDGRPVPSCLVLAGSCEGSEIVTVEGLGTAELHPFQEALVAHGGVQCGFCTPGIAVTGAAILRRSEGGDAGVARVAASAGAGGSRPLAGGGAFDDAEAARLLSGNLCRCTGYTKVLTALRSAAEATGSSHSETGPPDPEKLP